MTFNTRTLARAGAAALLSAGVLTSLATPALAEPTPAAKPAAADLAIKVDGLTVAQNASGKFATATITNRSATNTASGVEFIFVLGHLDQTKVDFAQLRDDKNCKKVSSIDGFTRGAPFIRCLAGDVAPGKPVDWEFRLTRKPGALPGNAGSIGVGTFHAGADRYDENNSFGAPVTIGGSGVDLAVLAPDVYSDNSKEGKPPVAVKPGETATLWAYVANQGDVGASGLKVNVALPKNVTLAEPEPDCAFSADKRNASCAYKDLVLLPADRDKNKNSQDDGVSFGWFFWKVTVAKGVKAPASLTGGAVRVQAIQQEASAQRVKTAKYPANFRTAGPVLVPAGRDIDSTDNGDEFTVFVAVPKADNGGNAGGGGNNGGGLPVTGPQAALVGGTGLAVAAVGGMLFFAARRRRVVLVTPGDEKSPTA